MQPVKPINSYEFFVQTDKQHIDFLNKIFEAYEGFGVVRTLDQKSGKIKIITVECFKNEVEMILNDLRDNHNIELEITKQGVWEGIL